MTDFTPILEIPSQAAYSDSQVWLSIAISLKRIADAMQARHYVTGTPNLGDLSLLKKQEQEPGRRKQTGVRA